MRSIISIILTLISLVTSASSYTNYFVPGTKWYDEVQGLPSFPENRSVYTVWLEAETEAYGSTCMPMYQVMDDDETTKTFVKYIKVEGDKVYYHPNFDGEWELMYDFGLQVDEMCYVGYPRWNMNQTQTTNYNYLVNTGDTEVQGIPSMNMSIYRNGTLDPFDKGVWLLGIGSTTGVLENCTYGIAGGLFSLLKVESNGTVVYEGTSSIHKLSVNSGVDVRTSGRVLSISGLDKPTQVRIYTASGALVNELLTDAATFEVKLNYAGLYIVRVGDSVYKAFAR